MRMKKVSLEELNKKIASRECYGWREVERNIYELEMYDINSDMFYYVNYELIPDTAPPKEVRLADVMGALYNAKPLEYSKLFKELDTVAGVEYQSAMNRDSRFSMLPPHELYKLGYSQAVLHVVEMVKKSVRNKQVSPDIEEVLALFGL